MGLVQIVMTTDIFRDSCTGNRSDSSEAFGSPVARRITAEAGVQVLQFLPLSFMPERYLTRADHFAAPEGNYEHEEARFGPGTGAEWWSPQGAAQRPPPIARARARNGAEEIRFEPGTSAEWQVPTPSARAQGTNGNLDYFGLFIVYSSVILCCCSSHAIQEQTQEASVDLDGFAAVRHRSG